MEEKRNKRNWAITVCIDVKVETTEDLSTIQSACPVEGHGERWSLS